MKGINFISAKSFFQESNDATEIDGKWYPARPYGLTGLRVRFKAAWMVFTGKADVLIWHKQ